MKRHYLATILLAVGLAAPALAAEKSTVIGGAGAATGAAVGASKVPKKVAAKKKPGVHKGVKVAKIERPGSGAKSPTKTTRRMRGYGN